MTSELLEPAESTVVDGLSDVDSEVEAAVISSSKHKHELAGFVLDFGDIDLGVLSLQIVRVYQSSFMVEVGWTLTEVLREVVSRLFL